MLFYLVHFLQFGQSIVKINCYEQLQSENREWKILCCVLPLSSKPQIWWFHVVLMQSTAWIRPKIRAARAARFFMLF